MDKRYQVFVSSTYADLKEERQNVIQTLMEMDCIPSGMELFPALDEEQFDFIKRVISDCDYYLLIVGGRYGSTTPEGVSYTEKEYDYAVSIGLKVIAFLHDSPEEISVSRSEMDPELRARLSSFRDKVKTGRLVKFWRGASDLPGLVSLSLSKTIKTYPAVGWVRANVAGSSELLREINELRKENASLEERVRVALSTKVEPVGNIAGMSELFIINGEGKLDSGYSSRAWQISLAWNEIFALIAPFLMGNPNDTSVQFELKQAVLAKMGKSFYSSKIDDHDYQTIKVQLMAYGLIDVVYAKATNGSMGLFWNLTKKGRARMIELRSVRSAEDSGGA